jgi:hypothetical protein
MRRWLLNLFFAVSLLLVILCLYAWARSYLPLNSRIDTSDGRLLIVYWEGRWRPNLRMIDPGDDKTYPGGGALWQLLQDTRAGGETRIHEHNFLGFGSVSGPHVTMHYHILAIPFWFFSTLALAAAVSALLLRRRYRFRLKFGHCLQCGYDLRESKDNCPECGAAIPAPLTVNPRAV